MTARISSDALSILRAFLNAYSESLSASVKIGLAAQVDALLAEGHDADKLTRAVQTFARTSQAPEHFGAWVRSRSRVRAWWVEP